MVCKETYIIYAWIVNCFVVNFSILYPELGQSTEPDLL